MPFTCSICSEESSRICVRCTKDACNNHICEKCLRCSDCCECEIVLSDSPQETVRMVVRPPAPEAPEQPAESASGPLPGPDPEPEPEPHIPGPDPDPDPIPTPEEPGPAAA